MSSGAAAEVLAATSTTAMVLLPTGELREYPRPATAARVLHDSVPGEGGWLLCDADAMGFEGPVAAMGHAEELRPGQIYFVLPAEVCRHGLRREEVAALAVKASAAISKAAGANTTNSGCGRRRRGAVAPLVFALPAEKSVVYKATPAARGGAKGGMRRQQPRFAPDLSAIPECDMSE